MTKRAARDAKERSGRDGDGRVGVLGALRLSLQHLSGSWGQASSMSSAAPGFPGGRCPLWSTSQRAAGHFHGRERVCRREGRRSREGKREEEGRGGGRRIKETEKKGQRYGKRQRERGKKEGGREGGE